MRPARVQLLVTCLVDRFFPGTGESVVRVLERAGVAVTVPKGQTCCGQPAFNAGYEPDARALARHTIDVLSASEDPVVVPSGSCGDMIIHQYVALLGDDPEYGARARAVAARTYELTTFLVRVLQVTDLGAAASGTLSYHASCHGLRGLGIDGEPKALLAGVRGATTCPLPEAEVCCGFGGLFAVKMSDISGEMLARKLDAIEASGADTIAVTDVSCGMHMNGGLRRRGSAVRVAHIADVLAGGAGRRIVNPVDVPFYRRVEDALGKTRMRHAVRHTSGRAMESRRAAIAELDSSDVVRDQARAIRSRTLSALDQHLDTFVTNIERNGGTVYFAETGDDAVDYIRRLARDRGIKTIVKGKSMVSEEIELNPVLERDGIEVVETDLGEFIVQLDNDKPSHIVAPILHKTKEDCARVFKEKLGASDEEVAGVPQMTQLARRVLRKAFLKADMGISGVNFGVAETGSICICTNEGNGRLTTSMPRIHVAMMGMERLVPTAADLGVMLEVLARSGTGQRLTVYSNILSGPRRRAEPDGPEEFHVVIVDNGRSKVLASELAEILYCIRCGACLYACPVYQQIGGHAYGSVYSGPVGSVLSPALTDIHAFHDLPHASTLCGACREVCPVRIDIPRMLLKLRAQGVEAGESPQWVSLGIKVLGWIGTRPRLFGLAGRVAARLAGAAATDGWIRELPFHLAGWTASRDFPLQLPNRSRSAGRSGPAPLHRAGASRDAGQPRPDARGDRPGRAHRAVPGGGSDGPAPGHGHGHAGHAHGGPDEHRHDPGHGAPVGTNDAGVDTLPTAAIQGTASVAPPTSGLPRRERFRAALDALAGVVHEAGTVDDVVAVIAGIAAPLGATALLSWSDEAIGIPGLRGALAARGLTAVVPDIPQRGPEREAKLAELAALTLGLTGADAGLADTGSVVVATGPGRPRMASLLVPVHIAVLRVDRLVDSISGLLASRSDLIAAGSNLVAITGPSRTADIEHTLSRGVHGPGVVHVILFEG